MSIINEALRKAGKDVAVPVTAPKAEPIRTGNIGITVERKPSRINWGPIFVISVLVLITGPIIAPFFSSPFKKDIIPYAIAPAALTKAPAMPAMMNTHQAQFSIEEAAIKPPTLLLTGIIFSPQNSYCILTEKVMKVGEEIDGAKLVGIQSNSITVEYQGQTVTIPVS